MKDVNHRLGRIVSILSRESTLYGFKYLQRLNIVVSLFCYLIFKRRAKVGLNYIALQFFLVGKI